MKEKYLRLEHKMAFLLDKKAINSRWEAMAKCPIGELDNTVLAEMDI
jgi:hypothetical protein